MAFFKETVECLYILCCWVVVFKKYKYVKRGNQRNRPEGGKVKNGAHIIILAERYTLVVYTLSRLSSGYA